MEAVREMIHDKDLPMHLWDEALRTAVYVQNRISQCALGNKTPKEMFTSENPKVSHLNIFRCHVYLHVPKEKRSKLDSSGKKGIFVGCSKDSKAYKMYILGFFQIDINRDVTFNEDSTFIKSRKIFANEDHEEEEEDPITTGGTIPQVRNIE